MPLDSSWIPSIYEPEWQINYIQCQIKKVKKLLAGDPENNHYKFILGVWIERLAKYDNRH